MSGVPLAVSATLIRIAVGAALGAVVGLERGLRGEPAGLRTHTLVGLASATFMVVSTQFAFYQHYTAGSGIQVDPSRIASAIVMGIGFLGGGAILRTGRTVHGLTTAAGLWLVASAGMAAGSGMYVLGLVSTAIGLGGLTLLRRVEQKGATPVQQRITVVLDLKDASIARVAEAVTSVGAKLAEENYELLRDEGRVRITFEARTSHAVEAQTLTDALREVPGILQIRIERA
jgi:putative Mg2+ transporter-C (MgtC) family protein